MELFRTVVNCAPSPEKMDYDSSIMMMGSCFAENLGVRLQQLKFNVIVNPFGIVYHPAPAAYQLKRIISGKYYTIDELHKRDELWHSFDHHGRFSHTDAQTCLEQMNRELQQAHEQLAQANRLFVTFGTAWGYRMKNTGHISANCHKFPSSDFERISFDEETIYSVWSKSISELRRFNPNIKIVFTLSPIRHLRDGAHENQLSKSTLLLAIERLYRNTENTDYFPAYEIVLDELRDYRFYADDMTHPNNLAFNYVWKIFCECYMDEDTTRIMKTVEDIVKAAIHRPIHLTSEYRKFAATYVEKIARLKQQMPQLDFTAEIERFTS